MNEAQMHQLIFQKRTIVLVYSLAILIVLCIGSCTNPKKEKIPEEEENLQNPLNPKLNALNDALLENPDNPEYYFKRAKVYFEDKNYRQALSDIGQAIRIDNSSSKYYVFLANLYKTLDKNTSAIQAAKHAETLNSQDPELYILMAQIYMDLGDKKNSDYYLDQSAILAPLHSEIFVLKGNALTRSGDTLAAIDHYLSALRKDKDNLHALRELAKIYDARKKYDSSMVFIVKGKSISNREPVFDYLGGKVFEHMSLTQAAKASYQAALVLDSSFYLASLNLANIFYDRNDLPEAIKWYQYSLKYDNDLPKANIRMAEILESLNRGEEAIAYYERACLIDTANIKIKASLNKLYTLYPYRYKIASNKPTIPTPVIEEKKEVDDNPLPKPKKAAVARSKSPVTSGAADPKLNGTGKDSAADKKMIEKNGGDQKKMQQEVPVVQPPANDKDNKDGKGLLNFKSIFKKKKNKDTVQ
jgi:tetratricopeptide (TPR) repeat protein